MSYCDLVSQLILRLEHNPSHPLFPGEGDRSEHRDGVFVSREQLRDDEVVTVQVDIRNTGRREEVTFTARRPVSVHANATLGDLLDDPATGSVLRKMLQEKLADSPLGSEIDGNPIFEAFMRFTPIGRVTTLFGVPPDEIDRALAQLRVAQARGEPEEGQGWPAGSSA